MNIIVHCDCGKKHKVPVELAGRKIRCRECNEIRTIPTLKTDPALRPKSKDTGVPTKSGSGMSPIAKYSIISGMVTMTAAIVIGIVVMSGGNTKDDEDKFVRKDGSGKTAKGKSNKLAKAVRKTQEEDIAAIKKLGGKVGLGIMSRAEITPPGDPVLAVDFYFNKKVTDAVLIHLKVLTNFEQLNLGSTKVSDAGLVHLKGLTNLKTLNLGYTQVSDAGLVHLKGLEGLQMLYLDGTKVTDAGLVHLKGLTGLQSLYLRVTNVTTAGVKDLQAALPNCKISH